MNLTRNLDINLKNISKRIENLHVELVMPAAQLPCSSSCRSYVKVFVRGWFEIS